MKSTYSTPSSSTNRAPCALAATGGSPPTPGKAPTGLLTPPGRTRAARRRSPVDRLVTPRSLLLADRHRLHHVTLLDGQHNGHAAGHPAEEVVQGLQLGAVVRGADEELRPIGVGPTVGHRQRARNVLLPHRLIVEVVPRAAA